MQFPYGPKARRTRWAAVATTSPMASLLALALAAALGCPERRGLEPPPTPTSKCERLAIPPIVVGANVMDHPDDQDADASNDGSRGYGSASARATLDRLVALGASGVVLPVDVRMTSVEATKVRPTSLSTATGLARLARMIDDAHERGLVVVVVPHLLLDDDRWRGDLAPTGARLQAFFASYAEAIAPIAKVAEQSCAEAFSFALELRSLTAKPDSDAAFSRLIREVRSRFSGALTYSANWDEAGHVRFWDELDGIAVNSFFPLASQPDASDAELLEGARGAVAALTAVQQRQRKPLWILELGFKATSGSFVEPWLWPAEVQDRARYAPDDQRRAYRAWRLALEGQAQTPATGVFIWAVPSDPDDVDHAWAFEPRWGYSFLGKPAEDEFRGLTSWARSKSRPGVQRAPEQRAAETP